MIKIDDTKIIRLNGKKIKLPKVLPFCERCLINPNFCEYDVLGFREPKMGEWYLSGATVKPYLAPNDLGTEFWVVNPTKQKKLKSISIFIDK